MATFGQDFLRGLLSGATGSTLKDYRHGSLTFTPDYYSNSPKSKFSFHVYFNLSDKIPGLQQLFSTGNDTSISYLVKNIQLPSYQIAVDEMNQYNRKRYIQSKIQYQPVQIEFHDDNADNIRQLWYAYYSYYYRDPSYNYKSVQSGRPGQSSGFSYNATDIYASNREANDFGFIGESSFPVIPNQDPGISSKLPFFDDITIYGFNQHNFSAYTLVNPIITDFAHDTYDYTQGNGTMTNRMTLKYELVKYYGGKIAANAQNVPGFGQSNNYDRESSSISEGRNQTILGAGGLLDAGAGILGDLEQGNYIGAALGALRTADTFKNVNIGKQAQAEVRQAVRNVGTGIAAGAARAAVPFINGRVPAYPTPPRGQALQRIQATQRRS